MFSYSNNEAKLKYKVGLMTISELNILGISNIRTTAYNFYTMTPTIVSYNNSQVQSISSNGTYIGTSAGSNYSIRPAISLIAGMKYKGGDGSTTNPYIADLDSWD